MKYPQPPASFVLLLLAGGLILAIPTAYAQSDVNECTEGTHTCHAQAYCTDTVGGYSCTCNSGYTGSGEECSDLNECSTRNGGCHRICHNTIGSFACRCGSGYSLASDGRTCNEPPSAPTNVRVSAVGPNVATVSWRAPVNSFPNSLTVVYSYRIIASQDRFHNGNRLVTKNSGATSHRFTDLEEYTTYSFTVTASNIFGRSQASNAVEAITQQAAPSAAPLNVQASSSSPYSISLQWSPPPLINRNGMILSYQLRLEEMETREVREATSTELKTVVDSLHPHYNYKCKVAAHTAAGTGPFSESQSVQTQSAAPSSFPPNLAGQAVNSTLLRISWGDLPAQDKNGVVWMYIIRVTEMETGRSAYYISFTRQYTFINFRPNHRYRCKVAAVTVAIGPFSPAVDVRLPEDLFTVRFEQVEYTFMEDAVSVQACSLVIGGTLSEALLLTLYTKDDTAYASREYTHVEVNVEINSDRDRRQCISIPLLNNRLPGSSVQFSLRVYSSSHSITAVPSRVTILDDEIPRGCTHQVLRSSISEEKTRMEVVVEITEVLDSIGISVVLEGSGVEPEGSGVVAEGSGVVPDEGAESDTTDEPPLKVAYRAIAKAFEVEATDEGYGNFAEAVSVVSEAKEVACEGGGSISAADVPRLAREYGTLKENVKKNIALLRNIFGKMLCISERDNERRRQKRQESDCPTRDDCKCPTSGVSVNCVCEFFACLDRNDDLRPILGLHDIDLGNIGFPCLALVVDTTGSMRQEIDAAKVVIRNFLSSEEDGPGCYILQRFNDYGDEDFDPSSILEPIVATTYNGESSAEELQKLLAASESMTANGGGDCPERQLDALLETLKVRDPDGYEAMIPGSEIVLLTDAPSHATELEKLVIDEAMVSKVCISFFLSLTGGCIHEAGQRMYERIANSTGGTVASSISQDGFLDFASSHDYGKCANKYDLPQLFGQRKKRQTSSLSSSDTYNSEQECHNFSTSLFTTAVKVTGHTSQHSVIVTKPNGERITVPTIHRVGAVFRDPTPLSGEWSVCVDNGTLTITLENKDGMDNILKYLRPIANSSEFAIRHTPPPACTAGRITMETSQIADIGAASIELLDKESDTVLTTAPLYGCANHLLANVTFPRATVKYRVVGSDINGRHFTVPLSQSDTLESEDRFRVEMGGENPIESEPDRPISITVTVYNLHDRDYASYTFTYESVRGYRQTFHPSNIAVGPGESGSVNMNIAPTIYDPGSSYTFTATVSDGCSSHTVSKRVSIQTPVTTPPPPPVSNECGCENGGTCTIRIIRGRVIRRCMCPEDYRGLRCSTYNP